MAAAFCWAGCPMTTRTIRQLDREPGQRPRTEVAGFVIDSDVPMPMERGRANPIRLAMEALQVGQSFLIPGAKRTTAALGVAKLVEGQRFRTRTLSTGVRVWRTE